MGYPLTMPRCLLLILVLLLAPPVLAARSTAGPHFTAKLVAESRTPAPGKRLTLALVINPDKGWHIYWKNPGEAGLPPQPHWKLPAGFSAGELRHPVPSEQDVDGLISNIHEHRAVLLTNLSVPDAVTPGTPIPVGLNLRLAVCTQGHCIPHRLSLGLRLMVGDGIPDLQQAGLFRQARAALPVPLKQPGSYKITASTLNLLLPLPAPGDISSAHVFFDGNGVVAHGDQRLSTRSGTFSITMSRKGIPVGPSLSGVVRVVHSGQGAHTSVEGYRFIARPIEAAPAVHG